LKHFLLLLKGKKTLDYSPAELQARLNTYRQWVATIEAHYVSDNRLERKGAHIRARDLIETDGPFLEAKEIIAGFIVLQANDLAEAIHVANNCPLLDYFEIIVRPIIA